MSDIKDLVVKNGVLVKYTGKSAEVIVPDGLDSIGDSFFEGCVSLSDVTIPYSVTSIGNKAFKATGISNVTLPKSIKSIGKCAFEVCFGLKTIIVPDSVTSIAEEAFKCCGLVDITIPKSIKILVHRKIWCMK